MSNENAPQPGFPASVQAAVDEAVRGFGADQAAAALQAVQAWLEQDGWPTLVAHEKQTALDLGAIAARYFSDEELLSHRIPEAGPPTDHDRLRWARDRLARAQADDESSCRSLCVVPLLAKDGAVAHLGGLLALQGQLGPRCEWLGLWASADALCDAVQAGGRYWLIPYRGEPADEALLALWRAPGKPAPLPRTFVVPTESSSQLTGSGIAHEETGPTEQGGGAVLTLYVNQEFDNEVTLGATMQSEIDEFGAVTWRELITEVLGEELPEVDDLAQWLEENYGIEPSDLDKEIDTDTVDNYYTELAYQSDNLAGAEAQAHDFVRDLGILTLDEWGDGSSNGVHLWRTTANGPRKFLVIDDQAAADWLVEQCRLRGVDLQVKFV